MDNKYAISVKDVSKLYKLYNRNRDRLKDAFGLSKHGYKEHYALKNLSFDVEEGSTVGIIGTNGAGKSTILKIITGVLTPTAGEVEINGRISALLELGAGFNPEYTGIENIYLNGTMSGFSKEEIDKKLDDILEFADISDYVYQPVKMYSSGMFVRLAFAVAINIDPEILIVDEALSVGDVFFQAKCFQKFAEFKKMGKTILFVSHDLGSIAKYCDKVILLDQGHKLDEGTPKEMIDLYKKIITSKKSTEETLTDETTFSEDVEGGWKKEFKVNPNVSEYGDKKAEIIDYAVVDKDGRLTSAIEKGTTFKLKAKIRFNEDIKNPIFSYTFKTIQGMDLTGTNTMYENKPIEIAKKGDVFVVTYEQKMDLQGGEYLLSMSCTSFENGELISHHRMYDFLNISVVSSKNTVGIYDMNSKVTIEKA